MQQQHGSHSTALRSFLLIEPLHPSGHQHTLAAALSLTVTECTPRPPGNLPGVRRPTTDCRIALSMWHQAMAGVGLAQRMLSQGCTSALAGHQLVRLPAPYPACSDLTHNTTQHRKQFTLTSADDSNRSLSHTLTEEDTLTLRHILSATQPRHTHTGTH